MTDIEKLRAFAKEIIQHAWDADIDGSDVQEIAARHGLITEEVYDPAKHGEDIYDAEPGEDTIYVFTDLVKG